jgi:hypothetical protein
VARNQFLKQEDSGQDPKQAHLHSPNGPSMTQLWKHFKSHLCEVVVRGKHLFNFSSFIITKLVQSVKEKSLSRNWKKAVRALSARSTPTHSIIFFTPGIIMASVRLNRQRLNYPHLAVSIHFQKQ